MCGFVGILQQPIKNKKEVYNEIASMADSLIHRGPDDSGIWCDERICIGLGHRRLAVLDLSEAGHQPMLSTQKRYVIVYNGEIYNFYNLKKELNATKNITWRGHSDTEVLLAAIEEWGIEQALSKIVGMFAFALWDLKDRTLYLARDRMGEKPLYYGINNKILFFGSELKAFQRHSQWQGKIDKTALGLFMRYGYIPGQYSIYHNIFKLMPGTYVSFSPKDTPLKTNELPKPISYWSLIDIINQGEIDPFTGDAEEAVDEVERLLTRSIVSQMIADVPLGVFLSGGIDSSLVTALMQVNSSKPVKTFTIGFSEKKYNEARYAKEVAKHLGTDHTELYLDPKETINIIPELPDIYDEPFADDSQIPTILVSRLARKSVTVCLSGDGGDELFCGYNRYPTDFFRWNHITKFSPGLRDFVSTILLKTPYSILDFLLFWTKSFRPPDGKKGSYSSALRKLCDELNCKDFSQFHNFRLSNWKEISEVVPGSEDISPMSDISPLNRDRTSLYKYMMSFDALQYLPDDILVKVDRAAMANSLETRVPFLDHRLVTFTSKIPLSIMTYNGQQKWLLKKLLTKFVPQHLFERPKMGFAVPVAAWLRGPLREWCEEMLDPQCLNEGGHFESSLIRKKWEEHLAGKHNWKGPIWNVLMFQAWRKYNNL